MAWPIGRLWRACVVGVGVGCTVYRRAMALAYGVQACVCGYGVRCYGVGCMYG